MVIPAILCTSFTLFAEPTEAGVFVISSGEGYFEFFHYVRCCQHSQQQHCHGNQSVHMQPLPNEVKDFSDSVELTTASYAICSDCCPVICRENVKFNLYTWYGIKSHAIYGQQNVGERLACPTASSLRVVHHRRGALDFNLNLFRRNPEKPHQILMDDYSGVQMSPIMKENPTVIYIHGFTEQDGSRSTTAIRKAYLKRGDYNVLVVDWSKLSASPWYKQAVDNTPGVGKYVAQFLHFLTMACGLSLATLHVIGFSLGAEVAGFIGKNMKAGGRLPRITGLDPAYPFYSIRNMDGHLSPSDAEFVDVIHTDGHVFGFPKPIGHADFFPNGGTAIQPGCWFIQQFLHNELSDSMACSHNRAWMYYAESVNSELAFKVTACNNYFLYKLGQCNGEPIFGVYYDRPQPDRQYMGFAANPNLRGYFYLETNEVAPYGRSSS